MDINNLFHSKTRRELFRLYFSNSDSEYYLRELERMLELPVSMIRKELMALEAQGLFKNRRRGNLVFYFLNKDYLLFNEIKSIVFKTIGIRGLLKNELNKIKGIKLAFLYGSFARDEADAQSDVDLFIVGDVDDDELVEKITRIEKQVNREINYNLSRRKEFEKEIKKEGSFINLITRDKIILLKGNFDGNSKFKTAGKRRKSKKS